MGKLKRLHRICLLLTVAAVAVACGPVGPIITPNAGDPDDCRDACDNFARLGCEESLGGTGPDGEPVTCVEICHRVVKSGVGMGQECVAVAETCAAARECE